MMILLRTELATLQRQVDSLGRSMQSPSPRTAPTPHLPSTDRNAPPAAGGGPDHPRADPTGHPDQPDIRPDTRDHRPLSKQASRTSIRSYQEPDHTNQPDRRLAEQTEPTQLADNIKEDIADEKEVEYEKEQHNQEKYPVENVEQAYEQGYENPDQNYAEKTEPYYEQTEGYDQNYQEGQFENYEQYPQQYTDPNAQYEGQYENYATDGYQQEYDQTQYVDPATQYVDPNTQYVDPNTQYVEPTTQYDAPQSEQAPTEHEAPTGSKISNSPVKGQS